MLQEGVGAEGEALLLAPLRIEAYQVAGNVLDFLLRPLLHPFPGTRAQTAHRGRLALAAFILRHLVQGVDAHQHDVVVLIHQLDHLLLAAVGRGHAHQSGEAPHAVVDVDHEVAGLKLHQFLEREGHLGVARVVGAQVILVEAVEDLVVGEEAEVQVVVGEALVQRVVDGGEAGRRLGHGQGAAALVQDVAQALVLLLAVGQHMQAVALGGQTGEGLGQQGEVFVKQRLRLSVEGYRLCSKARVARAYLYALQALQTFQQAVAGGEQQVAVKGHGHGARTVAALACRLGLGDGLSGEALGVNAVHGVVDVGQVAHDEQGVGRQTVGEIDQRGRLRLYVGHDVHALPALTRQLVLHLVSADALHLVAEEVDAEGVFRGIGIDVEDAAAHGIFAGLIDVVLPAETEVVELLSQRFEVVGATLGERQRTVAEGVGGRHAFGQGGGMGDDGARHMGGQGAEHLGAQYLVGGIALGILYGAAVGRRVEEHLSLVQQGRHVVVEIAGLLVVAHDDEHGVPRRLGHGGHHGGHGHGGGRPAQSLDGHTRRRAHGSGAGQCLHAGVGGIER